VTMFTEELPWLKGRDLERVIGGAVVDWLGWKRPAAAWSRNGRWRGREGNGKVGIVGYCSGGRQAYLGARPLRGVDALGPRPARRLPEHRRRPDVASSGVGRREPLRYAHPAKWLSMKPAVVHCA